MAEAGLDPNLPEEALLLLKVGSIVENWILYSDNSHFPSLIHGQHGKLSESFAHSSHSLGSTSSSELDPQSVSSVIAPPSARSFSDSVDVFEWSVSALSVGNFTDASRTTGPDSPES
jgi:hypothetical protein